MKINHIKIIGKEARGKTFLLEALKEKLGDDAVYLHEFTEEALKRHIETLSSWAKSLTIIIDGDSTGFKSFDEASSFFNTMNNEITSDIDLFIYQVCEK